MSKKEKKLIFISAAISLFIIVVAVAYTLGSTGEVVADTDDSNGNSSTSTDIVGPPEVGEPGSEHAHIPFLLHIEGKGFYDFDREKYAEQNNYAHFHHDNGIDIHKHATGVTLPYFLDTLGIDMTERCLIMDAGESYCEDGENKLTVVVNGNVLENPSYYELQHKDRILLNYGSEDVTDVRIRAQSVPDLPRELEESVYGPQE